VLAHPAQSAKRKQHEENPDVEYTQINSYVDYITVGYSLPF
jgi:hypothetical protein